MFAGQGAVGAQGVIALGRYLPGRRLAFDRMNIDRAQAPHPQHVHFEGAIDPIAVEGTDQVIDAIDINAVEADDDVARQQPGSGQCATDGGRQRPAHHVDHRPARTGVGQRMAEERRRQRQGPDQPVGELAGRHLFGRHHLDADDAASLRLGE